MQDGFDIVTIIFLCLAVFVIWKLRSVLGQRTGNERQPYDPFTSRDADKRAGNQGLTQAENASNIVQLPHAASNSALADRLEDPDRWKGIAEPGTPVAQELDAIVALEPTFDGKSFQEGAKFAYEMIVSAFAQGDRKTLKSLLSRDVYEGFDRALTEREKRGEAVSTTFVSVDNAELLAVELQGHNAQITVRFTSKLITATSDINGKIIDGAPDAVIDVSDTWTFARTLRSRDPNWQLVATESGG